jgi:4-carboxymuconolactone decarboxylase
MTPRNAPSTEVNDMSRRINVTRFGAGAAAIAGLLTFMAPSQAQERFSPLKLDQLSPEQQKMATILVTPPRNSALNSGPFNAYARSPGLGLLLLQVSDYVRFNSSLPPRLSEFAIMIAARQWSQPYEWRAHYPLAIKGGLDRQIVVDLAAGKDVSDKSFKAALTQFGERGIMDLIGIIGYYDIASMALISQRLTGKAGDEPSLAPLTR